VDTDSFQIGDGQGTYFPCPVGVPEYTPPELQGQLLAEITRQPCHDCFGLSVLLFQLLMEGYHPFTGRPLTAALREMEQLSVHCMQQGWFPYSNNQAVQPPPAAPPFTELPAEIRRLFLQSFLVGYTNPVLRPTAATWAQALSRAELNLVQCQKQREHWYSNHLKRCPYCQITPTVSTSSKNSVHPPRPTTPIFGAKAAPAISGAATPPIRPSSAPVAWAAELVQAAIGTLVFVVIFQAYWPILFGAFFALRNAQLRHFLWVAAKVCFRGFVSGSRLLGKGIAHTVRWLTPHARRGGRIFVAHWRGRPTALKEWVVVGLLIVLLVFINYLSSNPMAMSRQPDSPLLVSPLAQPVSGRGE
ncbi:MAG: hypothetical protein KDE19_00625, partial [Caldilineaceae bacterium]|nr:hypothetical protein [Caldilineaceae bacterium]